MSIDFDSFTPEERDNFVKNVLSEAEIKAAISAFTHSGAMIKAPEELLEFCFKVAINKMKSLHQRIKDNREKI